MIALPVYGLATATGVSWVVVLILTFIGAIAGAALGSYYLSQRQ